MAAPLKVCVVGSGNWGSAIAKIVGLNAQIQGQFDNTVKMWVFEEMVDGRKLTEIINVDHENKKYLPGKKLPTNVVAVADLVEAAQDADILIFVLPHQFVERMCSQLAGKIKATAFGISLIKGVATDETGSLRLISQQISDGMKIPVYVLMGANIANEVADEQFCEATIGAANVAHGKVLQQLFNANYFRCVPVTDANTVELCGALKNIVACGAGFSDGLGCGDNTKAAIVRIGLKETIHFIDTFFGPSKLDTYFESCGIADLITTCAGGRNHKVCEAFVKTGKDLATLEKEMLGGQRLQGPQTCAEVVAMLKAKKLEDKFPLFAAIHQVCTREKKPTDFIEILKQASWV